ncbi:glycosyltransferase family 4 protein [Enterovirga sp. CN4-39]|uniref:glycosyltransferase family 4 protein n=1 Tax=Enterovirga sp. CN4-39 TaxID=3400910 RepID=UPI003C0FB2D6
MNPREPDKAAGRIAIVVKGYPRLSETFIAQEIRGLEQRGLELEIWSLRHPTERFTHPVHREIEATVRYLPEYLYQEPVRVVRGLLAGLKRPGFGAFIRAGWRDLRRDPTPNRMRRLGQALVLARELPADIRHLHVHYLHTPASVVRYAAILTGLPWTFSAHAKDIWTTPDWDLAEKLGEARWGVTCTRDGHGRLAALAPAEERVELLYHGLDLSRFPAPPASRPARDGSDPADPLRVISVGRAVAKKGFDDLLRALAGLPTDLHWQLVHVGGGEGLPRLRALSESLGLAGRVVFLGPKPQPDIVAMLREADLFVLPAKDTKSGDRDGLPNVLMEAASQALPLVSTRFAGIPEFVRDGLDGVLVPSGDWEALSNAINGLARDPARRATLGRSARERLTTTFTADKGFDRLASRLSAGPLPQENCKALAVDAAP